MENKKAKKTFVAGGCPLRILIWQSFERWCYNQFMTKKGLTIKDLSIKIDDLTNSVNDLASATAVGFADVQNKLNNHDQRFDAIDKRFDQMNKKIENEIRSIKAEISLGIGELKEEIARLDIRIDRLFKQTADDISVLVEEQEKIKLRLKKLELKNSHG